MDAVTPSSLTPFYLYNWLQDTAIQKLVVDIRPPDVYEKGYLRTAINIPISDEFDMDLAEIDNNLTSKNRGFKSRGVVFSHIIIYDEDGASPALLRLYNALAREKKFKVLHTLTGGFSVFFAQYPFLCSTGQKKALGGAYPSEIEHGFLYLGSHENATNRQQLKDLGISHIVNMAAEIENAYPDDFTYLSCRLDDLSSDSLTTHLENVLKFIDDAKETKTGKVLVHCAMGISRSSALVIAYLMKAQGMSFDEAKEFVKSQRSCIRPNPGFSKQLLDFEKLTLANSPKNKERNNDNNNANPLLTNNTKLATPSEEEKHAIEKAVADSSTP